MENQVAIKEQKNITDSVLAKIDVFRQSGELRLPPDYSPENALKSAYLVLLETKTKEGKFALEVCTKDSIANALLKMVVLGLSAIKKQCDFIIYGNKLECTPEYTGNIALAIRYGGLKYHKANAIFAGDVFKFEIGEDGRRKLIEHKQTLESFGGDIIGAYVTYELEDGTKDMEIMNIHQIKKSWEQGAMKGLSPAHKNFTDQMAIKTVYNRACKLLIRASNDSVLLGDSDEQEQREIPQRQVEDADIEEISLPATAETESERVEEARPKTVKAEKGKESPANGDTLFNEQPESQNPPY